MTNLQDLHIKAFFSIGKDKHSVFKFWIIGSGIHFLSVVESEQ